MRLSLITVVYNNAATVGDAIESVTGQSHKDIEYIVIDGGSTDGTIDIIKAHINKIDVFVSEKDKGIYDAMNKGILKATGDVIGILNSDDIFNDENVLTDISLKFEEDPELDILYGNLVYVSKNNVNRIIRNWKSKKYSDSFFQNGNVPPHPTLFLKSRVYKEAGLFNLKYKLAADYEFMLRIFTNYNFKSAYINRLIVKMRLGGATNKNLKNIINGNKEILKSWKENGLHIPLFFIPLRIFKRLIQFIKK